MKLVHINDPVFLYLCGMHDVCSSVYQKGQQHLSMLAAEKLASASALLNLISLHASSARKTLGKTHDWHDRFDLLRQRESFFDDTRPFLRLASKKPHIFAAAGSEAMALALLSYMEMRLESLSADEADEGDIEGDDARIESLFANFGPYCARMLADIQEMARDTFNRIQRDHEALSGLSFVQLLARPVTHPALLVGEHSHLIDPVRESHGDRMSSARHLAYRDDLLAPLIHGALETLGGGGDDFFQDTFGDAWGRL